MVLSSLAITAYSFVGACTSVKNDDVIPIG
jgi:hypothetical protein